MNHQPPTPPARPCPICGKPMAPAHRPFCSARCRTIDLGRWLKGSYAIPTEEAPEDAGPPNDEQ